MQHQRLRDELTLGQTALKMNWDDRILQASKACEAWRSEADESNRKVGVEAFDDDAAAQYSMHFPPPVGTRPHCSATNTNTTTATTHITSATATQAVLAEQQRDSAISHVQLVTEKLGQLGGGADHLNGVGNSALPRDLRIQGLKGLQVSAMMTIIVDDMF